jgi:hypothetical protein
VSLSLNSDQAAAVVAIDAFLDQALSGGAGAAPALPGYSQLTPTQRQAVRDSYRDAYAAGLVASGSSSSSGHSLDANTIGLWRFDDASFPLSDATGNVPLDMHTPPLTTRVPGKVGSAWFLDGANNYLHGDGTALVPYATGDLTLEMWLLPDATAFAASGFSYHNMFVLGSGDPTTTGNWSFGFSLKHSTRAFSVAWSTGAGVISIWEPTMAPLPVGYWSHCAIARRWTGAAFEVDVWLNGVLVASLATFSAPIAPTAHPSVYVGTHPTTSFNYFPGLLDDTRFSKVARSNAEVVASYTAGL